MRRILLAGVVLVLVAGCEDRTPITRAQVVSNAYNLQLRDGLIWGDAVEALPPAEADERGRRWWQIRYRPGPDGTTRFMLVDGESGWARQPPAGYVPRQAPPAKISGEQPLAVVDGSNVLIVVPGKVLDAAQRRALDQEVLRLNALATNTGLMPLFSVREQRDQQVAVIYGWQNDHGIAREPRVIEWLTVRTPYRDAQWEELVPRP